MNRIGEYHDGELVELDGEDEFQSCHFYGCEFIGRAPKFLDCVFEDCVFDGRRGENGKITMQFIDCIFWHN